MYTLETTDLNLDRLKLDQKSQHKNKLMPNCIDIHPNMKWR